MKFFFSAKKKFLQHKIRVDFVNIKFGQLATRIKRFFAIYSLSFDVYMFKAYTERGLQTNTIPSSSRWAFAGAAGQLELAGLLGEGRKA